MQVPDNVAVFGRLGVRVAFVGNWLFLSHVPSFLQHVDVREHHRMRVHWKHVPPHRMQLHHYLGLHLGLTVLLGRLWQMLARLPLPLHDANGLPEPEHEQRLCPMCLGLHQHALRSQLLNLLVQQHMPDCRRVRVELQCDGTVVRKDMRPDVPELINVWCYWYELHVEPMAHAQPLSAHLLRDVHLQCLCMRICFNVLCTPAESVCLRLTLPASPQPHGPVDLRK